MNAKNSILLGLTVLLAALVVMGCGRESSTSPALVSTDPVVFGDDYGSGVGPQPFEGSDYDAFFVDGSEAHSGSASLKVEVPGSDGSWAGGALVTDYARDLSAYNALTFWAKSSVNSTLNVAGFANDNTGTSLYEAWRDSIPLTGAWTQFVIPIPNASRLQYERGLFYMAEAQESSGAFTLWFDDIQFAYVAGITNPRPHMASTTIEVLAGASVSPDATRVDFDVNAEDVRVGHLPGYLDYFSSNDEVALGSAGTIVAVGGGTAVITAKLDTVDVEGVLTVNVLGAPAGPAPAPTLPPDDVISLFSDVYEDVLVDDWHAPWTGTTGEVADLVIAGDNVKVYTDLNFAGIVFANETIDAATAGMTHLHMDVWAPSGGLFKVKLVDFGPNGTWDGPPADPFAELMFNGGTTPPFSSGQWSPLEIPLADFAAEGLTSMEHLAQMVISSSDVSTVIVDNVYFHR